MTLPNCYHGNQNFCQFLYTNTVLKEAHSSSIGIGRNEQHLLLSTGLLNFSHLTYSSPRSEWMQKRWDSHLRRNPNILTEYNKKQQAKIQKRSTMSDVPVQPSQSTDKSVKLIRSKAIDGDHHLPTEKKASVSSKTAREIKVLYRILSNDSWVVQNFTRVLAWACSLVWLPA